MNAASHSDNQPWTRKDLTEIEPLSATEIRHVMEVAKGFKDVSMRSIKKVPALRGKVVVTYFAEASTRTRTSFALAASRLSADVIDIMEPLMSTKKGESLIDTARVIESMGIDTLIIRHKLPGAPRQLAEILQCSVINAGDGPHEHPTQALLDTYTIMEHFGDDISGLKIAMVGDIQHSRVARSNIWALTKLGAEVTLIGPPTLVPGAMANMGDGKIRISHSLDDIIGEFDVINLLRIQMERQQQSMFPSIREYTHLFGIDDERMKRAKKNAVIMHPGPINRGVEISESVADGPQSLILKQTRNGLAIRMAVLYLTTNARAAGEKA